MNGFGIHFGFLADFHQNPPQYRLLKSGHLDFCAEGFIMIIVIIFILLEFYYMLVDSYKSS
jgi:hypothetical protein